MLRRRSPPSGHALRQRRRPRRSARPSTAPPWRSRIRDSWRAAPRSDRRCRAPAWSSAGSRWRRLAAACGGSTINVDGSTTDKTFSHAAALSDDFIRHRPDGLILRRMYPLDGTTLAGDQPGLPGAEQAQQQQQCATRQWQPRAPVHLSLSVADIQRHAPPPRLYFRIDPAVPDPPPSSLNAGRAESASAAFAWRKFSSPR